MYVIDARGGGYKIKNTKSFQLAYSILTQLPNTMFTDCILSYNFYIFFQALISTGIVITFTPSRGMDFIALLLLA